MKRFVHVTIILSILLMITISSTCAADVPVSDDGHIDEKEVVEEALRFLDDYTTMTFLYEDTALVDYPARLEEALGEASISLPADTFPCLTLTRQYLNNDTLTNHAEYLAKKAKYWKALREVQNILRDEFEISYGTPKVTIDGNYAQVYVLQGKSYYYRGETIKTYDSDAFEVFLVKIGDAWWVFDMYNDDGFDTEYHDAAFDVDAEIDAFTKEIQRLSVEDARGFFCFDLVLLMMPVQLRDTF